MPALCTCTHDSSHSYTEAVPATGHNFGEWVVTSPATGYITTYDGEKDGLQDGSQVTIINKRVEVTIEINKKIEGTSTPLPGAWFTLTQVDSNGNDVEGGVVKEKTVTDSQGRITFENIVPGRYKLEETDPPAGYIKEEGPYYINVAEDGTGSVEGNVLYAEAEGNTFIIQNVPGVALPSTGGPGTRLVTILGIILVLGAGVLLWRKRRLV